MSAEEFGKKYKVNEDYNFEIKPGEYVATISKVELKESKTGKPMAALLLSINNNFKLTYFLVDDRSDATACNRTNATLTRFFDCFMIVRGNFKLQTWLGKKGRVLLDYGKPATDGKTYLEVKKMIVPSATQSAKQQISLEGENKNELTPSSSQPRGAYPKEEIIEEEIIEEEPCFIDEMDGYIDEQAEEEMIY